MQIFLDDIVAAEGNVELTVKVSPPKKIPSFSNLDPTESGPTEVPLSFIRMSEPPPKAML